MQRSSTKVFLHPLSFCLFSTALAVLFTLVDSGIYVVLLVVWSGDSVDCSKLLNRVEPITQTKPGQTRGKEEKRKGEKGGKGETGEKGEK